MHSKTATAAFSFICSVGGWFLWCIILASTYKNTSIYYVKDGLWDAKRFGRNALWWLTLIMILACVVVFEIGVKTARAAFWTTDVDRFQELEKDPAIKTRFEDAATLELAQGWERFGKEGEAVPERKKKKKKKRFSSSKKGRKWDWFGLVERDDDESDVEEAELEVVPSLTAQEANRIRKMRTVEEEERREGEVRDLLRNRPDELEGQEGSEREQVDLEQGRKKPRASLEIQEMLARGFGGVKRSETLK